MRLLLFIAVQLSLWISGINAFFPYYPVSRCDADPSCNTEKRRSEAPTRTFKLSTRRRTSDVRRNQVAEMVSRARVKFAKKGIAVASDHIHQRRESVYQIVPAEAPSSPHTEGINQDGTDYSYFIEIGIGSEKKPMYMLVDTGAGTTWVMSSSCKSSPCSMHQTFGPPDSDSLEVEENPFEIHYGSGSVSGLIGKDTFHIAGFDIDLQFGLANVTSDDFNHFPFDGILGLGLTKGKTENLMQEMIDEEIFDKNVLGVYLNRASDGDAGGEISFGSINKDKYSGEITYTDLHDQDGGDWAITLGDFTYGNSKAGVSSTLAYIDTGTSYAFGPKSEVAKIFDLIDGSKSEDGITYTVPCDSDKDIAVSFSGRKFVISPKDWLSKPNSSGSCTGNIYGIEVVKDAWLLGDVFLKNVYAVFDADEKRIGFATRPAVTATTSAGSSVITSPPGTVTQGADDEDGEGNEDAGSITATSPAESAATTDAEPTPAAGDKLRSSLLYAICVAALASFAS